MSKYKVYESLEQKRINHNAGIVYQPYSYEKVYVTTEHTASDIFVTEGNLFLSNTNGSIIAIYPAGNWVKVEKISNE